MITDHLYDWAEKHPGRTLLVFEDRQITYGQMADMVSTMAQRLYDLGVRQGNRVALLCGNRPAFLTCWFAVSELGAVAVPLNVSLMADGLRYTLTQSEACVLLIEPELYESKRADIAQLDNGLHAVQIDESMEHAPAVSPGRWQKNPRPGSGSANSILYTSGTTGLPKGAVLSHGSYLAAGRDMVASLALTERDRIMVFLPLFHANPQMYAVTSVLEAGATMVLLPKFSAGRFFDDAIRYEATGFTFVGTVLSILEKQHQAARHDHGLKWCVGGGAPARVWREIEERFGVAVRELYGMTETGGWVTMNTAGSTRMGSVGNARRSVTVSIRDEGGHPVRPGEKGEIVVQSTDQEMFFTEYWNNPDATAATLKNGWLHTGDRGWLDEDGYLFFDGRVKELIRRGGEMIAPTEIEQQLLKHPQVQDCVVMGVADDIMGEEIKAMVVAQGDVEPHALRNFLAERIPAYMVPRYFSFIASIPKTETQKVKRHELAGIDAKTIDTRTASAV